MQFPVGERCCRITSFNLADANSIVTNYYQHGPYCLKTYVALELLLVTENIFVRFLILIDNVVVYRRTVVRHPENERAIGIQCLLHIARHVWHIGLFDYSQCTSCEKHDTFCWFTDWSFHKANVQVIAKVVRQEIQRVKTRLDKSEENFRCWFRRWNWQELGWNYFRTLHLRQIWTRNQSHRRT